MLHHYDRYIQSFLSLRSSATAVESSDIYQLVIQANQKASQEHFFLYNKLKISEIAAIIPAAEDRKVSKQDIDLLRRGQPTADGS